jgi:hypothetical protein
MVRPSEAANAGVIMDEHYVTKLASSNERASLEEAFCKLVDHEDEQVLIGMSVETGEQTLLKLCADLAEDLRVMPRHTVQAVNSYLDSGEQLAYGSSFSDGSRAIRDAISCWSEKFDQAQDRYLGDA